MERTTTGPIRLTFLGTRGEIDISSARHRRHSALLIEHGCSRIMLDCGADWRGRLSAVAPTAIVLTHAHPDHAAGLSEGAPCPVYATGETLTLLRRLPLRDCRQIRPGRPVTIEGVQFTAYRVEHSIRAPAVGYRIAAKAGCFFYIPDVAAAPEDPRALAGIDVYIGDGATMTRPMVRRKKGMVIGHASIETQLAWCAAAGIRRAVFTHCGSALVRTPASQLNAKLRHLGDAHDIEALVACDGDRLVFPGRRRCQMVRSRSRAARSATCGFSSAQPSRKYRP
jgi:phosphoribosyl 1,2-cyclic phosphodiesterase